MKLAIAPVGSWRHLSFIAHHHLNSPWFLEAQADPSIVLPGVRFTPTFANTEPYLSSSGKWSEVEEWIGWHAYSLPTNMSGCRYCSLANHSKSVRTHVQQVTTQPQTQLTRQSWSALYQNTVETALASSSSKLGLLAQRLQQPGPPLHISIDGTSLHLLQFCVRFGSSVNLLRILCQEPTSQDSRSIHYHGRRWS